MRTLRRWSETTAFYPLMLLLFGAITYLYALPWLGYFWDDWEVVFLLNARDPALFSGYFSFDRPFAWPYQVMYAVFGLNPVAWHVITFLARWGGILLLYSSLAEIWPKQRAELQWVGALALVYPGFLQQSISTAYNRHWVAFLIFALSIYLMVRAYRGPRTAWIPAMLSWVATLAHTFTIEYFVGLELIRPVILWLLVRRDGEAGRAAVMKVASRYLAYLAILGAYLWWRLAIFPATIPLANYAADFKLLQDFETSLLSGLLAVLTRGFVDLLFATMQVWLSALGESGAWTFEGKIAWLAFGLGIGLAALFAFLQSSTRKKDHPENVPPPSMAWFGLWAFLAAGIPIWLTSKQLSTQGRWDDRFALAPMLGAIILVVWLVAALIRSRFQRVVLASLLAISIVTQVLVVNRYRLDWTVQRNYYWQIAWRIPALQPGTAIISFEQPSPSMPGYDASFALNVMFRGKPVDGSMDYWFFTNDRFMNFDLKPDRTITYKDRNLRFRGNTSDAIAIIHQGEKRCLQVLDLVYADQPFYGSNQERLVALSDVSRISTASLGPPDAVVFGREPAHTWCYYFQKADLARQLEDWEGVLQLEAEAAVGGYKAQFGPELLPFIEAHARVGDWEQALELSRKAQLLVAEMEPLLCSTWSRLSSLPGADAAVVQTARLGFGCSVQ